MSSALMADRGLFSAQTQAAPPSPTSFPGAPAQNWCVVPRCEMEIEKCKGGLKLHCRCDDEVACATLQNLCKMLAGGTCSCVCTLNGITVCQCNLTCGICKCENTADGCCITCLSGDAACCEILQACCDTLAACLKNGCCCYLCINGTPCCCGCC